MESWWINNFLYYLLKKYMKVNINWTTITNQVNWKWEVEVEMTDEEFNSLETDAGELLKIIRSIILTTKNNKKA